MPIPMCGGKFGLCYSELWIADANEDALRQLTNLKLRSLGVPRWSPDSRYVAFFARTDTEPQIYTIDATQADAVPRQMTNEVPGCNIPTWSRDGKFLYCSRKIGGETRLYRVPVANGGGHVETEWLFEGKEAKEVSDGRLLYIKNDRPGLFARSLAGDVAKNAEERLVNDITGPVGYFVPAQEGVYYTGQDAFGAYRALRFYDYVRRQVVDVAPKPVTGNVNSLALSADGQRLLYTQTSRPGVEAEIELTLIEF